MNSFARLSPLRLGKKLAEPASRVFRKPSSLKPLHIVIYGVHTTEWSNALGPDAPVWKLLPSLPTVEMITGGELPLPDSSKDSVVIPLMESHIESLYKNTFSGYRSLLPALESVHILGDKAQFARYVDDHHLQSLSPKTYNLPHEAKYPCILKRIDCNAGFGIDVVLSENHLEEMLNHDWWRGYPFILQELISQASEYVAHCICKNGKIVWHCVYEYKLNDPRMIKRGICPTFPYTITPFQLSQLESFLKPIAYSGPCNFDFKFGPANNLTVFEINPRLGGSLTFPENSSDLKGALSAIIAEAN